MKIKMTKAKIANIFRRKEPRETKPPRRRRCNLCKQTYSAASVFSRFCEGCKQNDELFRFYESLPLGTL